jgi:hypothetical protein
VFAMALINSRQIIVVGNDLVTVMDDDGFVVCEGKSIEHCLEQLCEKMKQEANRR